MENLSRDSNKAADTEMIVERKLQALTNTPHWEGRGDWHRPRYLENVGHQRGMDRLDGRMGLNGRFKEGLCQNASVFREKQEIYVDKLCVKFINRPLI